MGWRPGKGIGPRLTKLDRKRKMVSHNKLYQGKSADGTVEVNKDEEDEFTEKYKVSIRILFYFQGLDPLLNLSPFLQFILPIYIK